jgi:pimeloyl-ACP methyl ester carboxylesterase
LRPTIVLVYGAFAESASWDHVIDELVTAGHPVIAAANPVRGLAADAAAVGDLLRTVDGPVVLVGHSYGGAVISNVAADTAEITGLVYVAATQRPVTQEALTEPSGEWPLWRGLPSWFLIAEEDRNIPAILQRFMAQRGGARRTLEIPGASHAVAVSQPEATAELILEAAALPAAT